MRVRTETRQAILLDCYDKAIAAGGLFEAIEVARRAQFTRLGGGSFLAGTSKEGVSLSFSLPPNTSPEDWMAAILSLRSLYSAIYADGGATDDASVCDRMMNALKPVRHVETGFSSILK